MRRAGTTRGRGRRSLSGTYSAVTLGQPGLLTGDTDTSVGFSGNAKATFGDHDDFTGTAPFTLEAWVKPTTVDATGRRIFSKEAGEEGYYLLSTSSQRPVRAARRRQLRHGQRSRAGRRTRYHVVVTYDGSTMRMYVNGTDVGGEPLDAVDGRQRLAAHRRREGHGRRQLGGDDRRAGGLLDRALRGDRREPLPGRHQRDPAAAGHDAAGQARHADGDAGNGSASVNLSPPNSESDLASYTLQRKLTSQGAASWAAVKTGVTTWPQTDTGLTNGTSYDYRVIALDTSGNPSTPSDPVSVTPGRRAARHDAAGEARHADRDGPGLGRADQPRRRSTPSRTSPPTRSSAS